MTWRQNDRLPCEEIKSLPFSVNNVSLGACPQRQVQKQVTDHRSQVQVKDLLINNSGRQFRLSLGLGAVRLFNMYHSTVTCCCDLRFVPAVSAGQGRTGPLSSHAPTQFAPSLYGY